MAAVAWPANESGSSCFLVTHFLTFVVLETHGGHGEAIHFRPDTDPESFQI